MPAVAVAVLLGLSVKSAGADDAGRVEIVGEAADVGERSVVAGKVILGRALLERSHVGAVREVLRRDPAISVSASGRIGLMGLPGYTQVLLDGEAPPAGLDPLELPPAQIERIEIIRGTAADTGLAAIAGSINVVRRSQRRALPFEWSAELGGPAGEQTARLSAQTIWKGEGGSTAGFALNGLRTRTLQSSDEQEWLEGAVGRPVWQSAARQRVHHDSVNFSPRVSFKPSARDSINVSADLAASESGNSVDTDWVAGALGGAPRPSHAVYRWRWRTSPSASLSLGWQRDAEQGGQWQVRANTSWMKERMETSGLSRWADGPVEDVANMDDRQRATRGARLVRTGLVLGAHKLQWGVEAKQERLSQQRSSDEGHAFIDDLFSPHAVGTNQDTSAWLQDDWQWSEALSLKLGLRNEHRVHRLDEGVSRAEARMQMLAPSLHAAWTLGEEEDHTLSVGLSRGFNVPLAATLSLRPILDPTTPCASLDQCSANRPDAPDRAGNAALLPERSWGLDVNLDNNVGEHGAVSVGVAWRWIDQVVSESTRLESVPWSHEPRWVARPANLGRARSHAIDLGFFLVPADWLPGCPTSLELTGSLKWAGSSISTVPGPYNRLPDQTPFTAKLGVKYGSKRWPLELRADASLHSSNWWQDSGGLLRWQNTRHGWSLAGTWSFDPKHQLTVRASPLQGDTQVTRSSWRAASYNTLQRLQTRPALSVMWVSQL